MKQLLPILLILILVASIVILFLSVGKTQQLIVVVEGNDARKPIDMVLNKYQDGECGMIIDDLQYASQVISPDGKTWFFHDHGGMAAWLNTKSFAQDAVVWVWDRKDQAWINGRTAWYSRLEETPMYYGFGAYSDSSEGYVHFEQMQTHMLRGETMADPAYRQYLLGGGWKQ